MKKNKSFLLLGSNLGDRMAMLQNAADRIAERIGIILTQSSIYETEPWGVTNQPNFLNQVLEIETPLHPIDVLAGILKIEIELGRERRELWSERTIDIDILYYEDVVMTMQNLVIPHPRLHERQFTLVPLVEIAPDFMHPKLKATNKELLENCLDNNKVTNFKGSIL